MNWAEDDIRTEYVGPGEGRMPEEGHTILFDAGVSPVQATASANRQVQVYLLRERTGERIEVRIPAVLGRSAKATTRIRGNLVISRIHARIRLDGSQLVIEDLGSANGTRVRGERIPVGMPTVVSDGDEIGLASEPFRLFVRS